MFLCINFQLIVCEFYSFVLLHILYYDIDIVFVSIWNECFLREIGSKVFVTNRLKVRVPFSISCSTFPSSFDDLEEDYYRLPTLLFLDLFRLSELFVSPDLGKSWYPLSGTFGTFVHILDYVID